MIFVRFSPLISYPAIPDLNIYFLFSPTTEIEKRVYLFALGNIMQHKALSFEHLKKPTLSLKYPIGSFDYSS